jgi:hypothetical protein
LFGEFVPAGKVDASCFLLLAWTVSEGTDTAGNKTTQLVVLLICVIGKQNGMEERVQLYIN